VAVIGWLILGLITAVVMRMRAAGRERRALPDGAMAAMFGAALGGALAAAVGVPADGPLSLGTWPTALLGALVMLRVAAAHRATERTLRLHHLR